MKKLLPRTTFAIIAGLTVLNTQAAVAQDASPAQSAPPPSPEGPLTGAVEISIIIIDELTPRPVPLTDFTLTPAANRPPITVRTDEQGVLRVASLPIGEYALQSVRPISFKGREFSWQRVLTVSKAETLRLKLTDADAKITEKPTVTPAGGRQIADEARIYQDAKQGVVTVEGDMGHGSGFIVDAKGLVVTNHHVIAGGEWTAVRFGPGIRVPAEVIADDPESDVAVVRFNPEAYNGFKVLALANTKRQVAVEGERVLAIGSPLRQEKILTTGIISKVERDVFISDVNINHGNSGGPLLNLAGEVIGINTFLDSTTNGPGISGVVSVTKAEPVIAKARAKLDTTPPPGAERLPDISPVSIPAASLINVDKEACAPVKVGTHRTFAALLYTPFTLAALQDEYYKTVNGRRDAKRSADARKKAGVSIGQTGREANPFWMRFALDSQDPFVMIEVRPKLLETSDSKVRGFTSALFGVQSKKELSYRDDFYDMELLRDGKLVQPVRRYRTKTENMFDSYFVEVHDSAYGGVYCYDPSVFAPGGKITIRTRKESDMKHWSEASLSDRDIARVWNQFDGYRAAAAAGSVR